MEERINHGDSFSIAYTYSLEVFGEKGFNELKKTSPIIKKKRHTIFRQSVTTSIAAFILLLVVSVDAQDKPNIHPLGMNCEITSQFGNRYNPLKKKQDFHKGIDFRIPLGSPINATANGSIKSVTRSLSGYGKRIIISHSDGYETSYVHLSEINVTEGQKVIKGEIIGFSGNSEASTAPHLHYEVIKKGEKVDPEPYFPAEPAESANPHKEHSSN